MSFNLPQKLPDFGDQVRKAEDYVWSRATTASSSSANSRGFLPMYKDKPQNSRFAGPDSRRSRWTGPLFLFGLVVVIFYFMSSGSDSFSSKPNSISAKEQQAAIKEAFLESWNDYEKYALGKDIYNPISKKSRNMYGESGLGWIVVDCLDTMMIMHLDEPLRVARDWVANNLTYDLDCEVSTFETTIRMLGGLLSAHYLSDYDDLYLEKAVDLANRLIGAFDSSSGIPYADVNLHSGVGRKSPADGGASSTAEATSLQLEFKYVAKLTGESLYWEKAEKVMQVVDNNHAEDGLVPIFIHPDTGLFWGSNIRLGSRGDSYYGKCLPAENNKKLYIYIYI